MLARPDRLPRGDYAYEVKWDGFRAIVSTEGTLRVRSRRGRDMTEHVTFLARRHARMRSRSSSPGESPASELLPAAVVRLFLVGLVGLFGLVGVTAGIL